MLNCAIQLNIYALFALIGANNAVLFSDGIASVTSICAESKTIWPLVICSFIFFSNAVFVAIDVEDVDAADAADAVDSV